MYLDASLLFSDKQAVTATANSANTLNIGSMAGAGTPIFPLVNVVQDFAGMTSLEVQVQSCSTENGAYVSVAATGALTPAQLNAAKTLNFGSLPPDCGPYVRLRYIVTGTATAGKLTAALVLDRQI